MFLDAINMLIAGVTVAGLNPMLNPDENVVYPRTAEVAYISMHGDSRRYGHCHFSGLMVPFAREWEESVDNGFSQTILPPEPGKTAGYAVVLNKLSCAGKPDEPIMNVAETRPAFVAQDNPRGLMLYSALQLQTVSIVGVAESERPKWLPQVMNIIETTAATNKDAKAFVDFSKQAAEASKLASKEGSAAQAE